MMISTRLSSRSYQSIMNDETLCDDLTTFNQNSSTSILYRRFDIHYISQEYVLKSKKIYSVKNFQYIAISYVWFLHVEDNSSDTMKIESIEREQSTMNNIHSRQNMSSASLNNLINMTPKNIAIMELISSEQRFVHDMENILKVIHQLLITYKCWQRCRHELL